MKISSVPAVLDYLVRRWTQLLPDVYVNDGQPLDEPADLVLVGFTGEPGESILEPDYGIEDMAMSSDLETYTITNVASSWKGAERDPKVIRDAVYGWVDTLATDLSTDPTLGGLVLQARISTGRFAPWQTDQGATAVLVFTVAVKARTGRG